jgi:DNA-binding transcriptional ArsR family regulator
MSSCRHQHPDLADVPLSKALAALADPCRVAIVLALVNAERELACGEFELTQSKATVSHHFRILREGGVIRSRTEGTRHLNSVRREEFEARFPGLLDLLLRESAETTPN